MKNLKFFISLGNIPSKILNEYVKPKPRSKWDSWIFIWRQIAKMFKDHKGLGGYHLCDEPTYAIFPLLAKCKEAIEAIDPNHPVWVNLYPDITLCGNDGEVCPSVKESTLQNLAGTTIIARPISEDYTQYISYDNSRIITSYSIYLQKFIEIFKPSFLSYDFYPIRSYSDGYRRPEGFVDCRFYTHLEMYHKYSKSAQCSFWNYPLVMPHNLYTYDCSKTNENEIVQKINGAYPMPTFAGLCLQIFASLAYGVQGFCFWAFFQRLNPKVSTTCGTVTEERISQEYISAPVSLPNS